MSSELDWKSGISRLDCGQDGASTGYTGPQCASSETAPKGRLYVTQTVVGVLGVGRVGSALAASLARAGVCIGPLWSRTPGRAAQVAATIPAAWAVESPQAVADAATLTIIAIPDRAIQSTADALRWAAGSMVVHSSGGTPLAALSAVVDAGGLVGGWHPLKSFAGTIADHDLRRITFGIEADGHVLETLLALTDAVGGVAVRLRAQDRARYHASAALASNGLSALVAQAAALWADFGVSRADALDALLPLVDGTLANIREVGLPTALTGPIERGDVETVRAHLAVLPAGVAQTYRALGQAAMTLAEEKGERCDQTTATLRALLATERVGEV